MHTDLTRSGDEWVVVVVACHLVPPKEIENMYQTHACDLDTEYGHYMDMARK